MSRDFGAENSLLKQMNLQESSGDNHRAYRCSGEIIRG